MMNYPITTLSSFSGLSDYLLHGDCLTLLPQLPPQSIDMVVIDPPYGCTHNPWDVIIPFDRLWPELLRVVKSHTPILVFSMGMFTADVMYSNRKLWRYNLIWHKHQPVGFLNARRQPLRCHEDICMFYKHLPVYHPEKRAAVRKVSTAAHKRHSKQTTIYGAYERMGYDSCERYPTSVLSFPTDKQKSTLHPTQKPVDLLRYLIRTYSDPAAMILDCCCGSGSTGVAALSEGRHYVMMEQDACFYELAVQRLRDISLNF